MNKKKELRELFHAYIDRKAKESRSSYVNPYYSNNNYNYNNNSYLSNVSRENFSGTIYFYEWSNIFQEPRKYFTIDAFERFLNLSGIRLSLYEKDIIKNMKWCYITCRKGCKDLVIRSSYGSLYGVIEGKEYNDGTIKDEKTVKDEKTNKEPYQVAITRPSTPKILSQKVFEPEGRWFG